MSSTEAAAAGAVLAGALRLLGLYYHHGALLVNERDCGLASKAPDWAAGLLGSGASSATDLEQAHWLTSLCLWKQGTVPVIPMGTRWLEQD